MKDYSKKIELVNAKYSEVLSYIANKKTAIVQDELKPMEDTLKVEMKEFGDLQITYEIGQYIKMRNRLAVEDLSALTTYKNYLSDLNSVIREMIDKSYVQDEVKVMEITENGDVQKPSGDPARPLVVINKVGDEKQPIAVMPVPEEQQPTPRQPRQPSEPGVRKERRNLGNTMTPEQISTLLIQVYKNMTPGKRTSRALMKNTGLSLATIVRYCNLAGLKLEGKFYGKRKPGPRPGRLNYLEMEKLYNQAHTYPFTTYP